MKKVIAVYSGGLDSSVMLCDLLWGGTNPAAEVVALSVNYGQRHKRELEQATKICNLLGVEHIVADLSNLRPLLAGSSQTDDTVPVPHGHYAAENMKKTVVPNRNMLLLSVAGALAISRKADAIAYAAHFGDHEIYPDCRETFVAPLAEALQNADWHKVSLERPFLKLTKADVVRHGCKIGAQEIMEIAYSCYEGRVLHCGLCGTCQERRVAFRDAGAIDPTTYEPAGLEKLPDAQLVS